MTEFMDAMGNAGNIIAVAVVFLLCIAGVLLSCISISGTWLILLASLLLSFVRDSPFPGVWTVVFFVIICGGVELMEAVAGWMGIQKRGGSKQAGLFAMLGGLIGLFVGGLIPIPVLGSLAGMMVGSFAFAYIVERKRLEKAEDAANIAWGAVISRIMIILLKVCTTMGMIAYLITGILLTRQ